MVSAENLALQRPLSHQEKKKKPNSMTLRLELPPSEDSGLGTLVKFVADPVVWWELSRSWVTQADAHCWEASHCLHWLSESAQTSSSKTIFLQRRRPALAGWFFCWGAQIPTSERAPCNRSRWSGPGGKRRRPGGSSYTRSRSLPRTLPRTRNFTALPEPQNTFSRSCQRETIGEKFTARKEVETSKPR